ncbi:MAG TPA: sulfocyanin-like copper-binding protein [Gemmatimonadales bacterium]|nr:sulfocyanin-like copper-binding protein [Gemmatimonadales bacterium]
MIRTLSLSMMLMTGVAATAGAQALREPDPSWLSWNATTRTTTFKLIGGLTGTGAKSPFNFNGYTDGDLTLSVPQGSTVVVNFVNDDGTPHSAEVIADKKPLPNMSDGQPAIPRAYTRQALEGLAQGQTDVMRFTAAPPGDYLFFCGVPGHGLSGMWIRLKVTADSAAAPALALTGK